MEGIDMQKDIWELTPLRIYDLRIVPRRLLEQVKGLEWNIDRVYALSENICSNPTNLIYVLYDEEKIIHGVLWARINILDENLYVSILSVDEEYQGVNGAPIDAAYALLNMVRNDANLKKIIWSTTRPKAYEKHGFKRSKKIIMEG